MAAGKELLTVEDVRGWLRVTEAARKEREAETRAIIIDRVLTEVTQQVQTQGRTVQDAADCAWRKWSRIASHTDERQIVADALEGIGWTRRNRGRKQ